MSYRTDEKTPPPFFMCEYFERSCDPFEPAIIAEALGGEKVKETQWHNLIAWGKVAEIAEKYLNKGSEVAIEGKLINRNYTDKEGNKKYVTEIQVNELLLLGSKAAAAEV